MILGNKLRKAIAKVKPVLEDLLEVDIGEIEVKPRSAFSHAIIKI
jgi:hypothetical protein